MRWGYQFLTSEIENYDFLILLEISNLTPNYTYLGP